MSGLFLSRNADSLFRQSCPLTTNIERSFGFMGFSALDAFLKKHDKRRIFFAALIFIVLRSPRLLLSGRLIAEEGTVYFQDAWDSPFWKALFAPHQGYYSLLDNAVAAVAAHLVPLPFVANTFTFSALLVLLLYVSVILNCEIFETPRERLTAVAIALLSPSLEIWLNLEDAQFLLAASAVIILFSNERRLPWMRNLILLFAGFTGPVACSFLPFFWVKALRKKTSDTIVQAVSLSLPTVVQAIIVFQAIHSGSRSFGAGDKLYWAGPIFFLKVVAVTFGTRLTFFAVLNLLLHHFSLLLLIACWVAAVSGAGFLIYIASRGGRRSMQFLAIAVWSLAFSFLGIGEAPLVVLGGANRYFFIADLLIWLMILIVYQHQRQTEAKPSELLRGLVVLLLFSGVLDAGGYWARLQRIDNPWRPQIARWQSDPSLPIAVNPADWPNRVHLTPKSEERR